MLRSVGLLQVSEEQRLRENLNLFNSRRRLRVAIPSHTGRVRDDLRVPDFGFRRIRLR